MPELKTLAVLRCCRFCKEDFLAINKRHWYCSNCQTSDEMTYTQREYRGGWEKRQIVLKRHRCLKRGIPFDLDASDIVIPEVCPVLGIKLQINHNVSNKDDSPSIDRIDPTKGYVKGNVVVISMKANRIKNDASLEELEKVYKWLKNYLA